MFLIKCQTSYYNNKNNSFVLVFALWNCILSVLSVFPHSHLRLMKCLQYISFSFSTSTLTNSEWFGALFKWLRTNQTCLTLLLVCISTLYVGWWLSTILHGPIHMYFNLARSLRVNKQIFYHQYLVISNVLVIICWRNFVVCSCFLWLSFKFHKHYSETVQTKYIYR